jgi:hypothetical protein
MSQNKAAIWYQGSPRTETGRILTLDGLLGGMPSHRREKWLPGFWHRVHKSPVVDGCWVWTGCRSSDGYGVVSVNRQLIRAHRLSFLLANGAVLAPAEN